MNRKYRKTVIVGNWKMFKTATETKVFLDQLKGVLPRTKRCSVILCLPYVNIPGAVKQWKDSRISFGAQNLHWAQDGAFTGEISAAMLTDLGVRYVIVGHSERRSMFGETDRIVYRKVRAALDAGLKPILCVGEDAEDRSLDVAAERVALQLQTALAGVSPEEIRRVIIAYEPVWAARTETQVMPEQAGEHCAAIRGTLRRLYGARIARSTTILYGGPMDESNAAALLAQEDVDGGLVGAASLSAARFLSIIQAASQE